MRYFAYGSNLLVTRLTSRVPSASALRPAVIRGWDLSFDKRGADGSGKATLHPRPEAIVRGVLYELCEAELPDLDRCEPGYRRIHLELETAAGPASAVTYVAGPEMRHPGLEPFHWYRDLVLAGARRHALPAPWIRRLEEEPSRPDPDVKRAAAMRQLLPL